MARRKRGHVGERRYGSIETEQGTRSRRGRRRKHERVERARTELISAIRLGAERRLG